MSFLKQVREIPQKIIFICTKFHIYPRPNMNIVDC